MKEALNRKYTAKRFVPKAHYDIYDWEQYVKRDKKNKNAAQKAEDRTVLKSAVKEQTEVPLKHSTPEAYGKFIYVSTKKSEKKAARAAAEKTKREKADAYFKSGKVKLYRSIGAKLIGIISALVIASALGITIAVSILVSKDTSTSAQENNLTINSRTATDTENRISSVKASVGTLLDMLEQSSSSSLLENQNASMFFQRNKDIIAVSLPDSGRSFCSQSFLVSHELEEEAIISYIASEAESIEKAKNGAVVLLNACPVFETPVIAMSYPLYGNSRDSVIFVLYSIEALYDSYASGAVNESYFINADGEVLIHPDLEVMMEGADFSGNKLVSVMMESKVPSQQTYFEENGESYYGAYKKLDDGSGAVITVVKEAVVLEGVKRTTRRNILLTVAVLSMAIMIVYFFAKSLSSPIRALTKVANEINKGNFNTDAFDELNDRRKDEVGVLINSTKNERQILNTFTKMTNKGVTEAIITKKIDFDPHLKDITIFFSDIRGFTAISDGFKNRFQDKSAGEIISFLNDYMGRMVNCITITGGNVDKFEGDAIMACWGVLRHDSLEFENMDDSNPEKAVLKEAHDRHVLEDALSAIRSTVAMRYSLAVYNKDAEAFTKAHKDEEFAKYKPHIRIGSGLNSGRATVGFMGSDDKMEFTSIGDAVNLASRTESSNKPCGTDILITEDTYNLLKKNYIRCEENNFEILPEYKADEVVVEVIPVTFEVKGKGKQHFYGVVNMPAFDIEEFFKKADPDFKVDPDCAKVIGPEGPENLHQVRSLLGIPEPDFGGVNLDQEENKIQIQTN